MLLTPEPQRIAPQAEQARQPVSRSSVPARLGRWLLGAAAAGVATGLLLGLPHSPSPRAEAPLSAAAQAERAEAFRRSGQWLLPDAPGDATEQARLTGLIGSARADLEARIQSHEARVVEFYLWDDQYEDGDVVEVRSAGFSQTVPLVTARRRIIVPVFQGQPVTLTGVTDGGGGITVAVEVGGAPVPLPVLAPGGSVTLPVGP